MSDSPPQFLTPEICATLPAPLADRIDEMLEEIATSGEHTTADETADVIEALMAHLGRLWIAEYLHAGPDDTELNRDLMERMGKSPLVGQWVGLARRIRHAMAGQKTVTQGLGDLDFGGFGDTTHPIARLVSYRNSFGHGSMAGVTADIREHRGLIAQVIETVPGLWTQPICVKSPETGLTHKAVRDWPTHEDAAPEVEALRPYLHGEGGERLDLYPLYYLSENDDGRALSSSFSKKAAHPVSRIFELSRMADWHERYLHEARGHLSEDYRGEVEIKAATALNWPQSDDDPKAALNAALTGDHNLILVEAHPGTGSGRALAGAFDQSLETGAFDTVIGWKVTPWQLTQSGATLAQQLLRTIEGMLGHPDGHLKANMADVLTGLKDGMAELSGANKRILLVIEGVHRGLDAYRGEPTSLLEVYRALAHGPITVLATTCPGATPISEKIPFDIKVSWPTPETIDQSALNASLSALCKGKALHTEVLKTLMATGEAAHLFQLCDLLDKAGHAVFEPAVERALWDMRPVLSVTRESREIEGKTERVRLWRPFSPAISAALNAMEVSS